MKMHDNTILITGGSSGIGLELARQLIALNNKVIITGRDAAKLAAVRAQLPAVHTALCDVTDPRSITALHEHIAASHPGMNMLINCAGIMRKLNLHKRGPALEDATREVTTNLNGTIWTNLQFLPMLKNQANAAIVNVSSGLAFVPMPISPVYSATKAAIHSYTLSLRAQLKNSGVRVFELAPPGTETPLFHNDFTKEDVGGLVPMPVATLVKRAIAGLAADVAEIRPGLSNILKIASRLAPDFMLRQLGKSVDLMLNADKNR
ncbi:SDR family NAD(P)-dependent oxidoreductase [Duganella dendranthematis]|jgi:uncharacterized oxidoreductase|uniref:SDR family NAD(P)-dependent oxidoreductase n=1 Tax=Duganella dendranthematis TaxID=2728021 RepID=A0ABX6MGD4_9BURK|nr:SDR family NAD(P)-dependent oxidoreductase [Duganella dendranthematis]QJD93401.1 SDR family NAD(P)-dependent oxidoreductase [Duganella dendranthematis]